MNEILSFVDPLTTIMVVSDCQKTPGELERARSPLDFNRAQRHVWWARGYFCVGKSHFPEQKYLPCSFHARKSAGFQWKLCRGGSGGGDSPPSTLVKKTFLTSWHYLARITLSILQSGADMVYLINDRCP